MRAVVHGALACINRGGDIGEVFVGGLCVSEDPPEVLFYHLEHQPLDRVLPMLLEKTIERGWRAVVQAGSRERLDALDTALWTYRDDSFLAHGMAKDGPGERQPIFLTDKWETPNGAGVRFMVDGAEPQSFDGFERIVFLFDGHDDEAIANARGQWRAAKDAGCATTYWQQDTNGRWQKKA